MLSLRPVIALSLLAGLAIAEVGPQLSTGPTISGTYITSSTASLILPDFPKGAAAGSTLSYWAAMLTEDGGLIQSQARYINQDLSVFTYTYRNITDDVSQNEVVQGPSFVAHVGDKVTMHCKSVLPMYLSYSW